MSVRRSDFNQRDKEKKAQKLEQKKQELREKRVAAPINDIESGIYSPCFFKKQEEHLKANENREVNIYTKYQPSPKLELEKMTKDFSKMNTQPISLDYITRLNFPPKSKEIEIEDCTSEKSPRTI